MELFDQIKTPRGALPTREADIASEGADNPARQIVHFELFSPEELAADVPVAGAGVYPVLEDVGLLMKESVHGIEIRLADIAKTATQTGPLFGRSNKESVEAWQFAIMLAHDTVLFQEAVNGSKPLSAVQERVVKTVIDNKTTGNTFVIYAVSFAIGLQGASEYEDFLPELPWFKKFASESAYDYAFIQCDHIDGTSLLSAFLISFESEITTLDFAAVLEYLKNDVSIDRQAAERLAEQTGLSVFELSAESTYGLVAEPGALQTRDEIVDEADVPHIQKLVHALISLHLQGITIDIFRSSEADDFMVFENFLSSLWYEFSMKLGQVQIGYCEQCGRGFSLSGHRGIRRRFCSEECKTKAKNARAKNQRDDARARFREGASLRAVAKACYPKEDMKEAMSRVRASLRSWKELQRDLDVAIIFRDEGRDVLARWLEEDIFSQQEILVRAQMLKENPRLMKKAQEHRTRVQDVREGL